MPENVTSSEMHNKEDRRSIFSNGDPSASATLASDGAGSYSDYDYVTIHDRRNISIAGARCTTMLGIRRIAAVPCTRMSAICVAAWDPATGHLRTARSASHIFHVKTAKMYQKNVRWKIDRRV